jgi:hypothetical protein
MQCAPSVFKCGMGIRIGCGGNVAALRIQDDWDHRTQTVRFYVNGFDDLLESGPIPSAPKTSKKAALGLNAAA